MIEWLNWLTSFDWVPPWVGRLDPLLGVGGSALALLVWHFNRRRRPALMRQVAKLETIIGVVAELRRKQDAVRQINLVNSRSVILVSIIIFGLVMSAVTLAPNRGWYWLTVGCVLFLVYRLWRALHWNAKVTAALHNWPDAPAQWIYELVEVRMRAAGFSDHEWATTLERLWNAAADDKELLSEKVMARIRDSRRSRSKP